MIANTFRQTTLIIKAANPVDLQTNVTHENRPGS